MPFLSHNGHDSRLVPAAIFNGGSEGNHCPHGRQKKGTLIEGMELAVMDGELTTADLVVSKKIRISV